MIAFELAAAMAGLAAAAQYIEPDRYSAEGRPTDRAAVRATSAQANQRQTRSRKPALTCSKLHKGYDAKTGTYRDARGKRQHCPR